MMNSKFDYVPLKSCCEQFSTRPTEMACFLQDQASFLHTVHPLSTHGTGAVQVYSCTGCRRFYFIKMENGYFNLEIVTSKF